ncbi:MAG: hypothetical protein S0880_21175 [Actinomycetota bacterium]|nr:hypothetical protein [Actinomycetota bacterium]
MADDEGDDVREGFHLGLAGAFALQRALVRRIDDRLLVALEAQVLEGADNRAEIRWLAARLERLHPRGGTVEPSEVDVELEVLCARAARQAVASTAPVRFGGGAAPVGPVDPPAAFEPYEAVLSTDDVRRLRNEFDGSHLAWTDADVRAVAAAGLLAAMAEALLARVPRALESGARGEVAEPVLRWLADEPSSSDVGWSDAWMERLAAHRREPYRGPEGGSVLGFALAILDVVEGRARGDVQVPMVGRLSGATIGRAVRTDRGGLGGLGGDGAAGPSPAVDVALVAVEVVFPALVAGRGAGLDGDALAPTARALKRRFMLLVAHGIACLANAGVIELWRSDPSTLDADEVRSLVRRVMPTVRDLLVGPDVSLRHLRSATDAEWFRLVTSAHALAAGRQLEVDGVVVLGT